jgi:SnoaL-like domain
VHRGHAGLAEAIAMLEGFEATLHEVSSVAVELDEDAATARGTAVCVAHHVRRREDGDPRDADDLILYGRYSDRFARDEQGAWRFASRELRVLWTERRPVRGFVGSLDTFRPVATKNVQPRVACESDDLGDGGAPGGA